MKTSDLTGPALDWAVVKADGVTDIEYVWPRLRNYSPSTDWSQGGPIIEQEYMHLHGGAKSNGDSDWCALRVKDDKSGCHKGHGPTPLIAAMRCYVASKLGDTVDIPEELCN